MASEAKDKYQEQLIYDLYLLNKEMITETLKQEIAELKTHMSMNITTLLNGKAVDIPEISEAILRMVEDELYRILSKL